jgi:hypothetical protein
MSSSRGMHERSTPITLPSSIPRRPSKAQSLPTVKLLCMKATSGPRILEFGLSSTLTGTTGSGCLLGSIVFDQIKATCDELEMTKTMCFKYDWNKEVIYKFYATLYFDADGQKLIWMIDVQWCEIIICKFARMLGLEHQFTAEPDARIHSCDMLKLDEM